MMERKKQMHSEYTKDQNTKAVTNLCRSMMSFFGARYNPDKLLKEYVALLS